MLLAYASTFVEMRSGDPRPIGSSQQILALAKRADTNLLFILIDTLRADRLGCYGYSRDTSPTLDYMASTGVRFARQLAQSSWTKCSMASLWTGLNPIRTGIVRSQHAAPPEATLPAEILRAEGFRTAGLWRNGWVAPNFGFGQGFEIYQRPPPGRVPASVRRDNPHLSLDGTDLDVVNSAVEFLRVNGEDRWFLYVHLMDVHQYLYDQASALFGGKYSDVYDNSIHHTDALIGQLITYLAETNLLQKTLVVISSDHGEAFSERGFEGHAKQVYRESTEVPFIVGFPFLVEPGVVVESRTRNIDVWPTILALLGLPALPDTDGRSLVPDILAASVGKPTGLDAPPAAAFLDRTWGQVTAEPMPAVALVDNGYRFVRREIVGGEPLEELFDANTDPLERNNVIEERPKVTERMRRLADEYLASPPAPWGVDVPSVELDEMELNQLRALGYAVP